MATDHFLRPLLSAGAGERHTLRMAGQATILASTIKSAFDSNARKRGLLDRDHLASDTALIIAPCSAIHTFGMRFPIDVIFVARNGRVMKITRALRPGRMSARIGAFAVIEMASGEADRHELRVGDVLEVRTPDAP